jgi:hypothetical protein
MKKRFNIINGFVRTAIFLMLLPALSSADVILLKDGQSIEAEKVYEGEGNIFFYLNGFKMRVSKNAVLRVTKTDSVAPASPSGNRGSSVEDGNTSNPFVQAEQTIEREILRAQNSSAKQGKKNRPEIRWSGFRNLCWAAGRSTLGRLKEVESGPGRDQIKDYVRINEDLKMGKARLDSIVYSFWRHWLYAVTIRATGHTNYLELRKAVFNRFGIGHRSDQNNERYLWTDVYSDRILKYDAADKSGLFWMRSKELNHRHCLSQIMTSSN